MVRFDELSRSMREAMAKLSDKHRRVIELRMLQGKAYADMLDDLGYTKEVTVRSLYMRAMQELQALLQPFAD
jgi:DNA-directed RNA polymerase specialized sigma24 family protein